MYMHTYNLNFMYKIYEVFIVLAVLNMISVGVLLPSF